MSDAFLTYDKAGHDGMPVEFVGKRGSLFWLALKTGAMTVLTLGFYRFWMKTRLRRWYWSAIRPGGHPMEYVGDPLEKLLGFFIAVVVLTFYIGIVNLVLMFASFAVFSSASIGYISSFVGVIPIWFYARYRARRYVLARTRWRGVRFGLEKGAWGYAWRALMHWVITIISLGALWPRMTFYLEKYVTDRTYFGSARLHQAGRWTTLYRATVPLVLSLVILIAGTVWLFWLAPVVVSADVTVDGVLQSIDEVLDGGALAIPIVAPERLLILPLAFFGMIYGAIHYRFATRRLMADQKSSEGIAFRSRLTVPRIAFIYVWGSFIAYLVLAIGIMVLAIGAFFMFEPVILDIFGFEGEAAPASMPQWLSLAILGLFYLAVFLAWNVCHNTFVTFPMMRHMAQTLSLPEHSGLRHISQRSRDEFAEAEGFAEALDLGAAI